MIKDPGFGIYIHWPFCQVICPYCDFNVHADGALDQAAWRNALTGEVAHYAQETPDRKVTSVYFGGGTPSLMPPATVAAIIESISKYWRLDPGAEITLEVNPTSAESEKLSAFKDAGVNRVSIGIQSFQENALTFLGRTHSAEEGVRALDTAHRLFDQVTFDLIYALPDQSIDDWRAQLARALEAGTSHLSLYQLMIEPGTPFMKSGVAPADEEIAADMFELTQEALTEAGYPAYEVSNHARPGEESRHNLTCWRGGDYVGIGPGAHGRVTIDGMTFGTHQIHNPARWLEKCGEDGHGTAKRRPLDPQDRARELIMMGLRLSEGLDKSRFSAIAGIDLSSVIDNTNLGYMIDGGLLEEDQFSLKATNAGRQRLNAMIAQLI